LLEDLRGPKRCILLNHLFRLIIVEKARIVVASIYFLHLVITEPLNSFSIFPQTVLQFFFGWHVISAQSVLFSAIPIARVASVVVPLINSVAMLFIVFILTCVNSAISPNVDANSFHIVFEPLTFVATAVKPGVNSDSANLIVLPVAGVLAAVVPLVGADAVLLT